MISIIILFCYNNDIIIIDRGASGFEVLSGYG